MGARMQLVSKIDLLLLLLKMKRLCFWRPNEPVVNGGVNEAAGWVFFQCNIGRGDEPTGVGRPRNVEVRLGNICWLTSSLKEPYYSASLFRRAGISFVEFQAASPTAKQDPHFQQVL